MYETNKILLLEYKNKEKNQLCSLFPFVFHYIYDNIDILLFYVEIREERADFCDYNTSSETDIFFLIMDRRNSIVTHSQ